ncbi:MAG TPA: NAD(P)/FAD-dependent oxidoreductase [Gemmatimonadales bacterium]|nr:NAD(P)/FAD-dependent oxidoreductase [Gemmatimonadales bacterium]
MSLDAVVIGAGPAGLATSHELARRGMEHVVLERGGEVGHTWANLYDSLTLHTGKHMSALPGRRFSRGTPLFVPRGVFWEYLRDYAGGFGLPVRTGAEVTRVSRSSGGWRVDSAAGAFDARAVVIATGIVANPIEPEIPGRDRFRGRVTHSVHYRRPDAYVGRRVLVVGVGNSGAEIGSEIARSGGQVTVSVRSGAHVVPLSIAGVPIQYVAFWVRKLPRPLQEALTAGVARLTELRRGPPVLPRPGHSPLDAIPLIGFRLVDEIRSGRVAVVPGIAGFTERGARFSNGDEREFDDVILATGFRAALGILAPPARRDAKGFAIRSDRVTSAEQPGLYFVGHNYDATGGLYNIARDAPLAAERVANQARG